MRINSDKDFENSNNWNDKYHLYNLIIFELKIQDNKS